MRKDINILSLPHFNEEKYGFCKTLIFLLQLNNDDCCMVKKVATYGIKMFIYR